MHSHEIDNTHDIKALVDSMAQLDLVVTISNATAHLAGLIGVPTILVTPKQKGRLWYWYHTDNHGYSIA